MEKSRKKPGRTPEEEKIYQEKLAAAKIEAAKYKEEIKKQRERAKNTDRQGTSDSTAPMLAPAHKESKITQVIAILSGKGGVGKSLTCSLLAVALAKRGYKVGVLDADLTGPSIPSAFGLTDNLTGSETGLEPAQAALGIKVVSLNLLLEDHKAPVVWRGPVIAQVVKQFWTEVAWGELDYLFIDMPPGTGDVALTVFQSLPVDAAVVVTSPQDMVQMIVGKAIRMAEMLHKPVVALVENMAYFECDECHKKHYIFGKSQVASLSAETGIPVYSSLPLKPGASDLVDQGLVDQVEFAQLDPVVDELEGLITRK